MQNVQMQKSTSAHRQWNSLEQGGAGYSGMCTTATSSSNFIRKKEKLYSIVNHKNRIKLVARQISLGLTDSREGLSPPLQEIQLGLQPSIPPPFPLPMLSGVAKPGPGRARPDQYYARPGQSE